jgi:hypothetical protein
MWHIENEGISRDVIEKKWQKYCHGPVPRDVDENK